jgi:hypothetical protein
MPSANINKIGPMIFEANLGDICMRTSSFEQALIMEKKWKSLKYVKMPDDDFNSILDMLLSEDPESQVLATKILLNNTEYQSDYLIINQTTQGDILENRINNLQVPLANSIAKIVKNEL